MVWDHLPKTMQQADWWFDDLTHDQMRQAFLVVWRHESCSSELRAELLSRFDKPKRRRIDEIVADLVGAIGSEKQRAAFLAFAEEIKTAATDGEFR